MIRSSGFGFDSGLRIISKLKVSSVNLVTLNAKVAEAFCVAGGPLGGSWTLFPGGLGGAGRGGGGLGCGG